MNFYSRDIFFSSAFEDLIKTKERKSFISKAKKLENYVILKNNPILAFKLSLEFDDRKIGVSRLQKFIINFKNPRYIFKFALEIKKANIKKLQDAIIKYGNILDITKFGCFVRGAQKNLIENLIIENNDAKSAYLYLLYVKSCNINKLKPIIIKSKKPRYLFALAKHLKNKKEIQLIEDLILSSSSCTYTRLFAAYIKGANIARCEEKIIQTGSAEEMRKFLRLISSPRMEKLSLLF